MSATRTKGTALITGASSDIGAIYAAATVASTLAAHAETPSSRARSCRNCCG